MAKPILRTPVLRGDDAKNFVERMIATEKRADKGRLNKIEKEVVEMFLTENK